MSAFNTTQDLIKETLANLGVLAAGQAVDPEDYNYVNDRVEPTFRQLAALEIVYVPDPNFVPGEWLSALADILAGECASKFGSTPDDRTALINKGMGGVNGVEVGYGAAAKSLRAMNRGRPTYEALRVEYI